MNTKLIQYARDDYGNPIACLVGVSTEVLGERQVYVGWSAYNKEAETVAFNKALARDMATGRAISRDIIKTYPQYPNHYLLSTTEDGSVFVDEQDKTLPYVIHNELEYFLERCKRYFCVTNITNFTNEVDV